MTPGERALREDLAVVDLVPRAVFSVIGDRALGYLHDVLAQDVADLGAGRGAVSAVLTANGRVAAEVRVLPLADRVLLDAEESARDGILIHIARHAPLAGAEVEDVSGRYVLAAVRGPKADEAVAATPGPAEAAFERSGDLLVVRVRWGVPGVDLLGPIADVEAATRAIAAPRATLEELDAARVEAGRPRFGVDVNEELLVNETPLLFHGVSMTKGCYPGQESVARIHNLGRIRRALRSLRSPEPLAAGADVLLADRVVGRVTSSGAAGDGWTAIGLLAADVEPGAAVRIDGAEAVVGTLD